MCSMLCRVRVGRSRAGFCVSCSLRRHALLCHGGGIPPLLATIGVDQLCTFDIALPSSRNVAQIEPFNFPSIRYHNLI